MDSQIVLFLKGNGFDYRGRTLLQLRAMSNERLEKSHDVVQWMFPTDMPSAHCKDAPILTTEDIATIRTDTKIQFNLQLCLDRMIRFYEVNDYWITERNHNFLRITRILRCLWLAGRIHDYVSLQKILDDIYIEYDDIIGIETYFYWKAANDIEFLNNPQKYISYIRGFVEDKKKEPENRNPYDEDDQSQLFNEM
jgi:hypothetical protein